MASVKQIARNNSSMTYMQSPNPRPAENFLKTVGGKNEITAVFFFLWIECKLKFLCWCSPFCPVCSGVFALVDVLLAPASVMNLSSPVTPAVVCVLVYLFALALARWLVG